MIRHRIKRLPRTQLFILLLLVNIALFITIDDMWRLGLSGDAISADRLRSHQEIVNGQALAPYRYRVLVPYTMEIIIRRLSLMMPYATAFLFSYALFFFAVLMFLLIALFIYCRLWLPDTIALVACLYAAITLAAGFRYFYPYSFLEVALFTTALYLIHERRLIPLMVILVIASLTRETAVFIVMAYAVLRRDVKSSVVLGLIWLAIFLGLRYGLGGAASKDTILTLWQENTSLRGLYEGGLNNIIFFGPLWLLWFRNWKHSPAFLQQSTLVGLLYLATITVFGRWEETRLLMFLYPIVLPGALSNFSDDPQQPIDNPAS